MLNYIIQRWPKKKILKIGKDLIEWMKDPGNRWLGSFCAKKGFHRQRLSEFAQEYPEFERYYKVAKQMQENKLIDMVFENKANPNFLRFLLINISRDLSNKKDINLSGQLKQKVANADVSKMSKDELREFLRRELSRQ